MLLLYATPTIAFLSTCALHVGIKRGFKLDTDIERAFDNNRLFCTGWFGGTASYLPWPRFLGHSAAFTVGLFVAQQGLQKLHRAFTD